MVDQMIPFVKTEEYNQGEGYIDKRYQQIAIGTNGNKADKGQHIHVEYQH